MACALRVMDDALPISSQKGYKLALFKLCAHLITPLFGLMILYLSTKEKVQNIHRKNKERKL